MKCFTCAYQNHTYSNLLHLIYHIANYLELRHVVSNSHRATVYTAICQMIRFFQENSFFVVCLFDLPSPINTSPPLSLGINLAKNRSCISSALAGKVISSGNNVVKILEIPFKCRGDYMHFYTRTSSRKHRIKVSHTVVTKISFGKGT